ncbi:MAG: RHS repeat-associated core domain-containing protein [Nanoarchaeota archaeon]
MHPRLRIARKRRQPNILYALFICVLLVLSVFSVSAVSYDFSYDANGNLIQDATYSYDYNGFNQLSRVREGNANGRIALEFVYGPDGERVMKTFYPSEGQAEITYYPDKSFVRTSNASGTTDEVYYYDALALVAREDANGVRFYYHPDHLGSTDVVTDANGTVVEDVDYEPFGEVIGEGAEGNISSRYLFTGQELDVESGLMYYGARYYAPGIMHFTQPDSLLADIYDPQQLNRYAYARNNPQKYVDKSGNYIESFLDVGFLAYDAYMLIKNPNSRTNWISLGADFAGLALPGATGLGMAVRAADKAGDAVRVAGKMGKGGKVASEIKGASSGIRTARDVSEGATSADKIIFSEQQVQKKFKHAKNFGVEGNYNNENAIKFKNALIGHINSKDTSQITGTFRGGEGTSGGAGGTHFFNSLTKQWVFVDARNKFVSAWKLKREQVKNLLRRRNVR